MKSFPVLFLLFIALSHTSVNAACTSPLADLLPLTTNPCDTTPQTFDHTVFTNLPSSGATKFTIAFFYKDGDCSSGPPPAVPMRLLLEDPTTMFTLSAKNAGGSTLNLIEVSVDTDMMTKVSTTDSSGISKEILTFQGATDLSKQRIAFSVDLEKGLFSVQTISLEGAFSATNQVTLSYGNVKFDADTELIFDRNFDYTDIRVEYDKYSPLTTLFHYVLGATEPTLFSGFAMDAGSGTQQDNTESSGNPLQFDSDTTTNPQWAENNKGVEFTDATQYMYMALNDYFDGSGADADGETYSGGFSFWIKPKAGVSASQDIMRFQEDPTTELTSYLVNLDEERKITLSYFDVEITKSTNSLPTDAWTFVTLQYFIIPDNANGKAKVAAIIYFGTTLQTSNPDSLTEVTYPVSDDPPAAARLLRGRKLANDQYQFIVGEFVGTIYDIKILAPALPRINYPSCLSNCLIDMGIDSPVCLTSSCPDGTTTCFESSSTDPDDENPIVIEQKDDGGLSGGAIAGIVIGSVLGGSCCLTALYFILKNLEKRRKRVQPINKAQQVKVKQGEDTEANIKKNQSETITPIKTQDNTSFIKKTVNLDETVPMGHK